jgi:hypothetical protein
MFSGYLCPVAYHRKYQERLLLKDEAGTWYLWNGAAEELTGIDAGLARWIYQRPEIYPVSGPAMWFEAEALPVSQFRESWLFD